MNKRSFPVMVSKAFVLVTLALGCPSREAFACTPEPNPNWWHGSTARTGPGAAIIGMFHCANCSGAPAEEWSWTVTDPDGNPVDGAVTRSDFSEGSGVVVLLRSDCSAPTYRQDYQYFWLHPGE